MDNKQCSKCGSTLFAAVPFQTTRREIVEFAQKSSLRDKEAIIRTRWIHPGLYCPNGCYCEYWEYGGSLLPEIGLEEAFTVIRAYSRKYLAEFAETHGEKSRCLACVHCVKFKGAQVEGHSETSFYKNPKLRPLRDSKIVSARCSDERIQALDRNWWYDQGEDKPKCDYFDYYARTFRFVYARATGWSEYPD